VKKPKVEKKEIKYFTTEETHEAITALYKAPVMWRLHAWRMEMRR